MKVKRYDKNCDSWYRSPRTTQERRDTPKRSRWARAKRNAANLPTSYDDVQVHHDKCWKSKREKQWRVGGRGPQQTIYVDGWYCDYKLKHYFEEHNIPFSVKEDVDVKVTHRWITHRRVCVGQYPVFREGNTAYLNHYRYVWADVPVEKPYVKTTRWVTVRGYTFTFWTSKRLDLSKFVQDSV